MNLTRYTKYRMRSIIVIVLMTVVTQITAHDDPKQESFDFAEISCWDIMVFSEKDRPYALTLLYGYLAGKNNISIHTGEKIEQVLEKTGEICADEPDEKALTIVQKIIE